MAKGMDGIPKIPGKKVLPNLQTLSFVSFNKTTVEQLEKGKFPILRKLGVNCIGSKEKKSYSLFPKAPMLNPLEYTESNLWK